MYCFGDYESLYIHSTLTFDSLIYILYFLFNTNKKINIATSVTLLGNVCLLFLLSFAAITNTPFGFSLQILGLIVVSLIILFALFRGFVDGYLMYEFFGTSILLGSAQLAVTFVPGIIQSKTGLSLESSMTLSIVVSIIALFILKAMLINSFTKEVMTCLLLSLLVVLNLVCLNLMRSGSSSFTADVCCDLDNECPLIFNNYEIVLFIALSIIILIRVIHLQIRIFIKWCKEIQWSRCRICCCKKKEIIFDDITTIDEATEQQALLDNEKIKKKNKLLNKKLNV